MAKVPQKIGEFSGIMHNGSVVGMALRTTKSSEYIYISPGHKISMRSSLEWSKKFCFHKAPEPIRRAHRIATELRNKGTK